MKKKKQISLKNSVFKMTVLYWGVPILIIIIFLSLYSNFKIKNTFLDEITITIESSAQLVEQKSNFLIKESKRASYDEIVKRAYLNYSETKDRVNLYRETISYLKNSYQYNSYITETILLYHDISDKFYHVSGSESNWSYSKVRDFIDKNCDFIMEVSNDIKTYFKFVVIDNELYLLRNLVDSNFKEYAILIFKVNVNELFNNLENLPFSKNFSLSFNGEFYNAEPNEINLWEYENKSNSNLFEVSNDYYLYNNSFNLDGINCEYRILIDTVMLRENYFVQYLLIAFILIMIIPLTVIASYVFYKQFSIPLRTLIYSANKIENGDVGYQIKKIPQSVEFAYVVERFNNMSTSMKEQIELIYKEQEALQNAKIKALQSQINPHFLNNTLEVINWEMRLGENQKAIEMIESLSTMLNASIARNEKPLKSLKEELIYVNAYLHIVKTRMGKRLNVIQEIDENVTNYKVPLLLLQPIVENSIEHGIANRTSGTVIIRAYEMGDNLCIEVENDNVLSQTDKERIEELLNWNENADEKHIGHTSLGIRNVNARIKLIFGDEYKLTIKSTEENATISQIILPKM